MTEEPSGTWLCPSCSPSAAFYVKQLLKKPAPSPIVPEFEGNAGPSGAKAKKLTQGSLVSTAGKAATPTTPKKKDNKPKANNGESAQKGTATKKPAAQTPAPEKPASTPKPKQRWLGWMEMSSDGEEEFKKAVNAQWSVDDSVLGKPRRASKATLEEGSPEAASISRVRGKKRVVEDSEEEHGQEHEQAPEQENDEEAESTKSVYQEGEDEDDMEDPEMHIYHEDADDNNQAATSSSDEASLGPEPSINDNEPLSDQDSSDAMSIDEESSDEDTDRTAQVPNPPSCTDDQDSDDSTIANSADVATRLFDKVNNSNQPRSRAGSPSALSYHSAPSSPMLQDSDQKDTAAPQQSGSHASPASDDSMEIDADPQHQEHQPPHTPTPPAEPNNPIPRYQRPWVEYPESAIRSTLPRLG